jgi:hypothetical protein
MRPALPERFWTRVDRSAAEGCWLWTGSRQNGYGRIGHRGIVDYAHRVAWELTYGPIPEGQQVLHDCDTPPCVRPEHLKLGTPAVNHRDRALRGRSHSPKGTPRPPRVAPAVVRRIRELLAEGFSQKALAKKFGISQSAANKIALGRTHKTSGAA